LSWTTVLRKREGYRRTFAGFDPAGVARFDADDVERLLLDASIVRHRGKIESTVNNAARILELREEFGSFDTFVWSFVDGAPIEHDFVTLDEVPSESAESRALSKELKRRDFKFVGATTMYALMQAAGLVDDHLLSCFRRSR
jgi:DNA-3-methyladenine glycosylase I